MKIVEYLKYYVGQPCSFGSEQNGWIAVLDDVGGCSVKLNGVSKLEYVSQDDVRPILRKLEDMTDEDAQEIGYDNAFSFFVDNNHYKYCIGPFLPRSFHYLLSKGYDVFGLIPAGLAIDSKTLNTPNND